MAKSIVKDFLKGKELDKNRKQLDTLMRSIGLDDIAIVTAFEKGLTDDQGKSLTAYAKKLAEDYAEALVFGSDLVIQDGFGQGHRDYPSLSSIQKYRPSFVGALTVEEIRNYQKSKNPDYLIMGGSKEDKMIQLRDAKAKRIFATGGLAFSLAKALDMDISNNIGLDAESLKIAQQIIADCSSINPITEGNLLLTRTNGTVIEIPGKVKIIKGSAGKKFDDYFEGKPVKLKEEAELETVDISQVGSALCVDTDESAIEEFFANIHPDGKAVWNGPVGVADDLTSPTAKGSKYVVKKSEEMIERGGFVYVAGGETGEIAIGTKIATSTGGGVITAMIQGKPLHIVEAVGKYNIWP